MSSYPATLERPVCFKIGQSSVSLKEVTDERVDLGFTGFYRFLVWRLSSGVLQPLGIIGKSSADVGTGGCPR